MEKITLKVEENKDKVRLDSFIEKEINHLSRSRIQKLLEDKMILVNDKYEKASYKVRVDDQISIDIPDLKEISALPEKIDLNIVYEDKDIIVINKQKGLVTHPAPGTQDGTLVNALLYHCKDLSGIGGSLRPGIVHRIDKDTTGLLVVAKNDLAHQDLAKQIHDKKAKRFYKAIVIGNMTEDSGIINKPIDRNPKDRKKMAVVLGGREAITKWQVIERFGKFTLIELELETGRTHQIRVHLAYIKHGVIGDQVYGPDVKIPVKLQGQALHAYKLILNHPVTKQDMTFLAEEHEEFNKLLDYLRKNNK